MRVSGTATLVHRCLLVLNPPSVDPGHITRSASERAGAAFSAVPRNYPWHVGQPSCSANTGHPNHPRPCGRRATVALAEREADDSNRPWLWMCEAHATMCEDATGALRVDTWPIDESVPIAPATETRR